MKKIFRGIFTLVQQEDSQTTSTNGKRSLILTDEKTSNRKQGNGDKCTISKPFNVDSSLVDDNLSFHTIGENVTKLSKSSLKKKCLEKHQYHKLYPIVEESEENSINQTFNKFLIEKTVKKLKVCFIQRLSYH